MKNNDISKMSLRSLKARYGKSNGRDREAEEELQRRGLNSKQLGEVLWEQGQQEWRKESKKASKIRGEKRARKRIKKRNWWWKHIRKRRPSKATMPNEGTTNKEPELAPPESETKKGTDHDDTRTNPAG